MKNPTKSRLLVAAIIMAGVAVSPVSAQLLGGGRAEHARLQENNDAISGFNPAIRKIVRFI